MSWKDSYVSFECVDTHTWRTENGNEAKDFVVLIRIRSSRGDKQGEAMYSKPQVWKGINHYSSIPAFDKLFSFQTLSLIDIKPYRSPHNY